MYSAHDSRNYIFVSLQPPSHMLNTEPASTETRTKVATGGMLQQQLDAERQHQNYVASRSNHNGNRM